MLSSCLFPAHVFLAAFLDPRNTRMELLQRIIRLSGQYVMVQAAFAPLAKEQNEPQRVVAVRYAADLMIKKARYSSPALIKVSAVNLSKWFLIKGILVPASFST